MLVNDSSFWQTAGTAFDRWREQAPVHRTHTPDGHPVWVVTRYSDVRAGLADPRLSLNKAHSRDGYTGFALPPALDANLLNMDPPGHTRLRRLIAGMFTVLTQQHPRMRLAIPPDDLPWRPSFRARGLSRLPVVLEP